MFIILYTLIKAPIEVPDASAFLIFAMQKQFFWSINLFLPDLVWTFFPSCLSFLFAVHFIYSLLNVLHDELYKIYEVAESFLFLNFQAGRS